MCGDYLCDDCVRFYRGQYLCRKCLDITRSRAEQPRLSFAATIIAMLSMLVSVTAAGTIIPKLFSLFMAPEVMLLDSIVQVEVKVDIAFEADRVTWVGVIAFPVLTVAAIVVCIARKSSRLLQMSLICTNVVGLAWFYMLASAKHKEIQVLCMSGVLLLALMFAALGNAHNEGTPWQRFFTIAAAAVWIGFLGIVSFSTFG